MMKESYDKCGQKNKHHRGNSVQPVSFMLICENSRKGCACLLCRRSVSHLHARSETKRNQLEPASLCMRLGYTHSLGTGSSCQSEEGTTATPAEEADGRVRGGASPTEPAVTGAGSHLHAGLLCNRVNGHLHLSVCRILNLQHRSRQAHVNVKTKRRGKAEPSNKNAVTFTERTRLTSGTQACAYQGDRVDLSHGSAHSLLQNTQLC